MKFKCFILFLLIPFICQPQSNRIDSLAKLLPALGDSSRIDCLKKLSVEYYTNALAESYNNVQTDTAISYASQAYKEAIIIHYKNGVANRLLNLKCRRFVPR